MKIIPNTPYETNSNAEKTVFDRMKAAFFNNNKYTAFHSLNLTQHEKKRFGEADFVIICEFGLFVLEVKGGGISCSTDGLWSTTNRKNENHRIQNPFKQAEGALHSIKKSILGHAEFSRLKLSIGYGVVFPSLKWTVESSEWDKPMVCDKQKIKNFEPWLRKFFSYWNNKTPNKHRLLSADEIRDIAHFLRPNFELIEPLYGTLPTIKENAVKLTEDQYKYIDIAEANSKVLCSGGAGTGKTFLAAELARRLGRKDLTIALICKSKWLKQHLEGIIIKDHLTISTIDSLKVSMRRSGVKKFDAIIVDEGQDLFNFEDLEKLENVLDGGFSNGEWYIFHDINNQSGLFSDTKIEALKLLESYSPANIPLRINCRNSEQILKKVQDSLQLDMGAIGTGSGPQVHEHHDSKGDGGILEKEIKNLLANDIPTGSITILSPLPYESSSVSLLPEKIKRKIKKLDDFSVRSFPIQEISFSEIKNFKGLENEIIIVVDLKSPEKITEDEMKVEHYVALRLYLSSQRVHL